MSKIEVVQSTFCPNDDRHHVSRETVGVPLPGAPPETLIDYVVTCSTCGGPFLVHAEERWRVVSDPTRTLYRSEAQAGGAQEGTR